VPSKHFSLNFKNSKAPQDGNDVLRKWDSKGEAMCAPAGCSTWTNLIVEPTIARWYAVATLSRHEWAVSQQIQAHGLEPFLPTKIETHLWSDRRKKVELPLFPGYVFFRTTVSSKVFRTVRCLRGCAGILTMQGKPVPIPDEQISGIQKVLEERLSCTGYSYLTIGRRVRVRGGSLDGIEGILVRTNGENSLVMSVDGIARSLAIRIEGYDIEQV
jgi:transcription antitermination factor NusG